MHAVIEVIIAFATLLAAWLVKTKSNLITNRFIVEYELFFTHIKKRTSYVFSLFHYGFFL